MSPELAAAINALCDASDQWAIDRDDAKLRAAGDHAKAVMRNDYGERVTRPANSPIATVDYTTAMRYVHDPGNA